MLSGKLQMNATIVILVWLYMYNNYMYDEDAVSWSFNCCLWGVSEIYDEKTCFSRASSSKRDKNVLLD